MLCLSCQYMLPYPVNICLHLYMTLWHTFGNCPVTVRPWYDWIWIWLNTASKSDTMTSSDSDHLLIQCHTGGIWTEIFYIVLTILLLILTCDLKYDPPANCRWNSIGSYTEICSTVTSTDTGQADHLANHNVRILACNGNIFYHLYKHCTWNNRSAMQFQ